MSGNTPAARAQARLDSLYGTEPARQDPMDAFKALSRKHRLPVNVLLALGEGQSDLRAVDAAADKIAQAMQGGATIEDAVIAATGEEARGRAVLDRAYTIADELAPPAPAAADSGNDGRVGIAESVAGIARDFGSGMLRTGGGALEAAGVVADEAVRGAFSDDPSQATPLRAAGRAAGDVARGAGEGIAEGRSEDYQRVREGTQPGGSLADPSSWTLGDDPSLLGLAGLTAEGLGSMAPVVAAGILTKSPAIAGSIVGGLMGGGEGVETGRKFVEDAAKTLDENGRPVIEGLPEYQKLREAGTSHDRAVADLTRRAENESGFRQGMVAGLGGAATNRILMGADGWLGRGGRLARAGKKGGASALEEGAQETAEGVAGGLGIEAATGANVDLMEDSFGNFVAGSLAGGAMGAGAGALGRGTDRPEPQPDIPPAPPAPPERLALPAPENGGTIFGRPPSAEIDPAMPLGLPSPTNGGAIIPPAPAPRQPGEPEPVTVRQTPDLAGPSPDAPAPLIPVGGSGLDQTAAPSLSPSLGAGAAVPDAGMGIMPVPPVAPPAPPAGPVEAIAQSLAASMPAPTPDPVQRFPDQKPGATVLLGMPEGANENAVFLRETPTGALVRIQGQEVELTPEAFDAARNQAEVNAIAPEAGGQTDVGSAGTEGRADVFAPEVTTPSDQPAQVETPSSDAEKAPAVSNPEILTVAAAAADVAPAPAPDAENAPVAAAAEATNPAPTAAQAAAENYKTGKARWNGLRLSIENKAGSTRSGTDPDGRGWSVTMPAHYGRVLRTEGADGDHVDFYMGPNEASQDVWVVDQIDADTGTFDEHKTMLGFDSAQEARAAHAAAFSDGKGPARMGGITKMSAGDLKAWLKDGDTKSPLSVKARRKAAVQNAIEKDAPAIAGSEDPQATADQNRVKNPQRRPFVNYVANTLGGVNPGGKFANELRYRGITARVAPGLFRRGGHRDLDNIVASEHSELTGAIALSDDGIYLSPQSILDAIIAEVAGEPLAFGRHAQDQMAARDAVRSRADMDDTTRPQDEPVAVPDRERDIRMDDERRSDIEREVEAELEQMGLAWALTEDAKRAIIDGIDRDGGFIPDAIYSEVVRSARDDIRETPDNGRAADQIQDVPFGDEGDVGGPGADTGAESGAGPEGDGAGSSEQGEGRNLRPAEDGGLATEPGADGLPQVILPGMERDEGQRQSSLTVRQRAEIEARQQQSKARRLDGNAGDAGPLFNEQQDLLSETPSSDAPTRPDPLRKNAKAQALERAEAIRDYFTPGNIVSSYGGGRDRVISFAATDDGGFNVTVEAVRQDGDAWVAEGTPRTHSTIPDARQLRSGPIERVASDNTKESRFTDDPVATLTGDELGEWSDIRDLRIKAQNWYRDHLQGQVITNEATGWEIRLTRAAKGKMGGKGQFLLQAVPALERIIAKAEKVGEAGEVKGRDHIKAYHYLRAPIVIDGERESLIVTVREMQDGRKFYDLNRDNLVGTRTRGPMDAREARVEPDVEIGTDTLNMAIENERVNGSDPEMAPADARRINAAARAELEKIGIAGRVRAKAGGEGRAAGTYQRGVIRILRTRAGKWRHTLDHEILHALRDPDAWGGEAGLFTRPEWSALARAARADRDVRDRVEAAYPDLTEAGRTEEMVAEFYADWAQGNREAPAGPLAQALGRIRSFFNAVASALRGEGFQDAASIMRRIAGGEVGGRGPDRPSTGLGAAREQRNMDGLTAAQTEPSFATRYNLSNPLHRARGLIGNAHWRDTPKLFSDFLSNKMTDSMGSESASSLALVPGRALFSELGKGIQAAQRYLHEKEAMDAERNDWHGRGDKVAKSWWKLRLKDSASNQQLMDLMHRATLSGIDPSKPDGWEHPMADKLPRLEKSGDPGARMEAETIRSEIEGRMRAYAKLKGEFDALPQAFKELFNTVRDEYTGLADAMDAALIENMKIASEIGLKRAQRTHRKEMRRIEEEGLTGPERDNAILEADTALDAAERQAKAGTAERMVALRRQFESNRLSGPYFPLARFGKYFVTIKDPAGKVVSFSRFERKAQQDAFVRDAEERGLGAIERGSLDTGPDLKTMVDPVFVADVEGMLQKAGANPELMDAVWQHWLQTLPDQSIRTNQIHRKGRTGYNPDAFRAFGKQMFHGSHQLARLKHGLKMSEILQEAKEEAARSDNPERDTFVVQEMQRRHEFTMNPKGAPWTSALTSIGFVWYLGMSPAAALVNVSQTTLIGVPMMGHRFKKAGVSGSVTAITKAMRDFADGRGWSEKSSRLTDEEKAAMDQAYRLGTIDKTQAHDLASVAESGVEYSPLRQAVMEKIGFMFHHAERLNREVTFLANYRLAKADGMDHETAIREASDLTWKIHFDYQNSARPRIMQNDVAKVVLLFRSYTVNLLWRLFRDTHQTFHGKSPEARAEAKAQLVGITLSMMAHAGIRGVWGYGIIMGLLGVFFPGGDDDAEKWMENALLMEGDDPGTAAWNWMMKLLLDGAPGQLTGVDLTQRIGSPSLWFRDSGRDLEGADAWNHLVNDMLGPVFGIGAGVVKGVSMMSRDPWRGIEASMPKFIRDPMQAYRFATEGATTLNGDPLIENMGPGEVLAKISGFTPARLSHRYRLNNWLKNDEKRIMERRKDLHRSIGRAVREGEPISDKLRGKIEAFNREYPFYPITADSIRQSVRGQIRASERNEGGVQLNPRLDRHIREGLPPSRGA